MENLVPLGTGNSRLMKSNIPASTTLAQLIQMWNNGTFPYDIGPLNSAGISQQGTPLNKDTLLKDATAALFGLDPTAVPNDMFVKIKEALNNANTEIDGKSSLVIGTYTGANQLSSTSSWRTINLGFRPKAVFLATSGQNSGLVLDGATIILRYNEGGHVSNFDVAQIVNTGFQVRNYYHNNYTHLGFDVADNGGGYRYNYIAFQ